MRRRWARFVCERRGHRWHEVIPGPIICSRCRWHLALPKGVRVEDLNLPVLFYTASGRLVHPR